MTRGQEIAAALVRRIGGDWYFVDPSGGQAVARLRGDTAGQDAEKVRDLIAATVDAELLGPTRIVASGGQTIPRGDFHQ